MVTTNTVVSSFTRKDVESFHRNTIIFTRRISLTCYICKTWSDYHTNSGPGIGLHTDHTEEVDGVFYILPRIYPEHDNCREMFNLCPPLR